MVTFSGGFNIFASFISSRRYSPLCFVYNFGRLADFACFAEW